MRRPFAILMLCLGLPGAAHGNLLVNPGFDTDLASWNASLTTATWNALDVNGSGSSGSAQLEGVGSLSQCVAVSGDTYTGGASAYIPSAQPAMAQGLADLSVTFFAQADCMGLPFNTFLGISLQPSPDQWGFLPISGDVPEGATSASFQVQLVNVNGAFTTHFDDATFEVIPEPQGLLLFGAVVAWWRRRGATRS